MSDILLSDPPPPYYYRHPYKNCQKRRKIGFITGRDILEKIVHRYKILFLQETTVKLEIRNITGETHSLLSINFVI